MVDTAHAQPLQRRHAAAALVEQRLQMAESIILAGHARLRPDGRRSPVSQIGTSPTD